MTPGMAAELWRPPIKLFAFDLILSFLPSRWTWTGEHMGTLVTHIHTYTHKVSAFHFLLTLSTSLPLSCKHKFALICPLYSISNSFSLSLSAPQKYAKINTEVHETKGRISPTKSIAERRWWWNNYVKTVLPVSFLHTKWVSGAINFTPAFNHNPCLPLPS